MDDKFHKKLDQAIRRGKFKKAVKECNNPEESALLSAGEQIYQLNKTSIPTADDFQANLLNRLQDARSQGSERESMTTRKPKVTLSSFWKSLVANRRWSASIAVFVLVALIASLFYWLPALRQGPNILLPQVQAEENFQLKATQIDSAGIDPTSDFLLISKQPLSLDAVKANFKITPEIKHVITAKSATEFLVDNQQNLDSNQIYQFGLTAKVDGDQGADKEFNWAYQVKDDFKVISTLPADETTSVPIDTGIEITFSHSNFTNWESNFNIEPKVEGRFEKHNKTLVFIPEQNLPPITFFKITISRNLPLENSDKKLSNDFSFAFETDGPDKNIANNSFNFYKDNWHFSTNESPAVAFQLWSIDDVEPTELPIKIFQFSGQEQYISAIKEKDSYPRWAYFSQLKNLIDSSSLKLISETNSPVAEYKNDSSLSYVLLPEKLDLGYYLVEIKLGDRLYQTFAQITNLAAYTTFSDTQTLLWVFDLNTKQPATGSTVSLLNNDLKAQVDKDGVAYFNTPEIIKKPVQADKPKDNKRNPYEYFIVDYNGQNVVIPFANERYGFFLYDQNEVYGNHCWHYLYTDRSTYQPTDTIKAWGFVKPRDPAQSKIKSLHLVLQGNKWNDGYNENIIFSDQEIKLTDGYTFQADIELKQIPSEYYNYELQVRDGEQIISRDRVDIETYIKNSFQLMVKPEQEAVMAGTKTSFLITAKYFDGTPASNIPLNYSWENSYQRDEKAEGEVTTDQSGQARVELDTIQQKCDTSQKYYSCFYHDYSITVSPKDLQESEIFAHAYLRAFDTDVQVKIDTEEKDEQHINFAINTSLVDLSKVNSGQMKETEDFSSKPSAKTPIHIKIIENYYEKIADGNYYDFISKKTIPRYKYENKEREVKNFTATTDEQGNYEYLLTGDSSLHYQITVDATDSDKNISSAHQYFYGRLYRSSYTDDLLLIFENPEKKYKLGEKVSVELGDSRMQPLPTNEDNHFLFYKSQLGLREYTVTNEPKYSFAYEQKDIPNVYIAGVWFDGYGFKENMRLNRNYGGVSYDYSDQKLNIKLTPDKEKYNPGDQVKIDIEVLDVKQRPTQVQGNISVVDEAYFHLFGDYADPFRELYEIDLPTGIIDTLTSHDQLAGLSKRLAGGMGVAGGGGGVRENFLDNAFFASWETDRQGRAQVTFTLPDNITSWRATAQAISENVDIGHSRSNLIATQPIQVNAIINQTYLTTDKPIVQMRADGSDLKANDTVEFTISSDSLKIEEKITGKAFENVVFSLPAMTAGPQDLTIKAVSGANQDAIKRTFMVQDTYLTTTKVQSYALQTDLKLPAPTSDSRTEIKILNQETGDVYATLQNALWQYGDRLDQKIARAQAVNLLQKYYEENQPTDNNDYKPYIQSDGGFSLLPYSSSDVKLSALAVASLPSDGYLKQNTLTYFRSIVDNKSSNTTEIAYALYGLANLDEPVLTPSVTLLGQKDLTTENRLCLALTVARLGAKEYAKTILNQIVKSSSQPSGPYLYLNADANQDNSHELTALASILAAITNHPNQTAFWGYINHKIDQDNLFLLEKNLYSSTVLARGTSTSGSFHYSLGDKKETISLSKNESFSLNLTSKELAQLQFSEIKGDFTLITRQNITASSGDFTPNPQLAIKKAYYVDGQPVDQIKGSDLVEIRLYPELNDALPDGLYEINDILPSGLKSVTRNYLPPINDYDTNPNSCAVYYPFAQSGQKTSFVISKNWRTNYCGQDHISYFARVSNQGDYAIEPVAIHYSQDPSAISISHEQGRLSIK